VKKKERKIFYESPNFSSHHRFFSILPLTPPSHAYSGEISRAVRNVNLRASYFQRDILAGVPLGTDKPRKKLVRHETRDKNSKSERTARCENESGGKYVLPEA